MYLLLFNYTSLTNRFFLVRRTTNLKQLHLINFIVPLVSMTKHSFQLNWRECFHILHPKQAVGVLSEDFVPPVVCVRLRHGLYPSTQQLVPQEGGIRHGVCTWRDGEGGEHSVQEGFKLAAGSTGRMRRLLTFARVWTCILCFVALSGRVLLQTKMHQDGLQSSEWGFFCQRQNSMHKYLTLA